MNRILHVVTYMGRGGLETMLMNYYRHIDRSKLQFDFLTHRHFEADYDAEIRSLGGRIYHLPRLNPFSREYLRALDTFFEAHPEYRIVHVHQDCMSAVVLRAAAEHGVRVRIAHSHSSSQNKDLKYPIKLFYRRFIPRYATQLMACSKEAGDWMFCGKAFRVIPNAVDATAFRFDPQRRAAVREKLGLLPDEFVIGHVGRFSPPKNHSFLLRVFAAVRDRREAKLVLVGDGALRPEIENTIRGLGLGKDVLLTGVRSDVADLLQAMDVFLFPSLYEGLPVTLIEAQAAGLPCLISERVPLECAVTGLVQALPLKAGADHWAENALAAARTARKDMFQEIKEAGYEITDQAEKLVAVYERLLNECGCG